MGLILVEILLRISDHEEILRSLSVLAEKESEVDDAIISKLDDVASQVAEIRRTVAIISRSHDELVRRIDDSKRVWDRSQLGLLPREPHHAA